MCKGRIGLTGGRRLVLDIDRQGEGQYELPETEVGSNRAYSISCFLSTSKPSSNEIVFRAVRLKLACTNCWEGENMSGVLN